MCIVNQFSPSLCLGLSRSSHQPTVAVEESGAATLRLTPGVSTDLNTQRCGARTWRSAPNTFNQLSQEQPTKRHNRGDGVVLSAQTHLSALPLLQESGQAMMEERLMMQQQQMEDDQRWLEQEESFMVHKHRDVYTRVTVVTFFLSDKLSSLVSNRLLKVNSPFLFSSFCF